MGPTLAGAILAALREEIAATADKAPSSTGGYISVADAASVLGVSSRQIYRQVKSGALPSRRVGERIVIPRDALR
jgi:excisionase family DNA binding protein